jgi:hypothetical protein
VAAAKGHQNNSARSGSAGGQTKYTSLLPRTEDLLESGRAFQGRTLLVAPVDEQTVSATVALRCQKTMPRNSSRTPAAAPAMVNLSHLV